MARTFSSSFSSKFSLLFVFPLFAASFGVAQAIGHVPTGAVAPPTAFFAAPRTGGVAPPTGVVAGRGGFLPGGQGLAPFTGFSPSRVGNRDHHGHAGNRHAGTFGYGYAVPYAVDPGAGYGDDAYDNSGGENAENYPDGPPMANDTGADADPSRYLDRGALSASGHNSPPADSSAEQQDDSPPQPVILVFKDGHQLEIGNYAIVSRTLYDLTPGHTRKIEMSLLDLEATERINEDRGVIFQWPQPAQAN
ncbi:MAG TPA: hypothetical protein VND65_17220 [Candidatus Binatia bacterium]|nr:hypothetical protein [Candidatus Binatia bacterium]